MTELPPFFSTPALTGLLQQLKHLTLFSCDTLLLEGEAGAGKSTLLHEHVHELSLQNNSDFSFRVEMLKASEQADIARIVDKIAPAECSSMLKPRTLAV